MFSEDTDASVVTTRILRETRAAREKARRESAASEGRDVPYLEANPSVGRDGDAAQLVVRSAGAIRVPDRPNHPPADADAYYRRGRLGVVAVLVLVLLWLWIRQRRAAL